MVLHLRVFLEGDVDRGRFLQEAFDALASTGTLRPSEMVSLLDDRNPDLPVADTRSYNPLLVVPEDYSSRERVEIAADEPGIHCRGCNTVIPEGRAYWHRAHCVGMNLKESFEPSLRETV